MAGLFLRKVIGKFSVRIVPNQTPEAILLILVYSTFPSVLTCVAVAAC
jgi:hypothetical protein